MPPPPPPPLTQSRTGRGPQPHWVNVFSSNTTVPRRVARLYPTEKIRCSRRPQSRTHPWTITNSYVVWSQWLKHNDCCVSVIVATTYGYVVWPQRLDFPLLGVHWMVFLQRKNPTNSRKNSPVSSPLAWCWRHHVLHLRQPDLWSCPSWLCQWL